MVLASSGVPSCSENEQNLQNAARKVRHFTPDTFAVLLLDIDHFGQYNDTHGHLEGNKLLQEVADILQRTTRDTDVPARLDRDVFAVLLPKTPMQGAIVAAERLRAAIAAHPGRQSVSVSVGIASKKKTSLSVEQVMDEAEQALALAKKLGHNCVIHFDLAHVAVCQQVDADLAQV